MRFGFTWHHDSSTNDWYSLILIYNLMKQPVQRPLFLPLSSSERCSCGDLVESDYNPYTKDGGLTKMEVVVLSVTNGDHKGYDVDDGCCTVSMRICKSSLTIFHVRVAEAFFPKYLAWYLPITPFGLTSGAEPLGSFS
jgi:hypothetical protein